MATLKVIRTEDIQVDQQTIARGYMQETVDTIQPRCISRAHEPFEPELATGIRHLKIYEMLRPYPHWPSPEYYALSSDMEKIIDANVEGKYHATLRKIETIELERTHWKLAANSLRDKVEGLEALGFWANIARAFKSLRRKITC